MRKSFLGILIIGIVGIFGVGCDTGQPANTAPPPVIPQQPGMQVPGMPGQPAAVPGMPGQPAAVPGIPGQPAAVPGIPGQPAAVPGVPGQPAAVPGVPGQPAAVPGIPGQPAAAPSAPVATGDVLVDKINTKLFEAAPAMTPTSTLLKQALAKGKTQSYQVQLAGPPYCQTYVASAGDTVKNIDLVLESPAGAKEASDDAEGNVAAIVNHCPTMPGMYKLTVSMPAGEGEFAVQVFSK